MEQALTNLKMAKVDAMNIRKYILICLTLVTTNMRFFGVYGVRVMGLMIAYICTFSSVRAKCPSSSLAQKAIYSVLLCKGIQRWVSFTNLIMTRLIRVYDFFYNALILRNYRLDG